MGGAALIHKERWSALRSVKVDCLDHDKARRRFGKEKDSRQRVRDDAGIIGTGEHSILFVGANSTCNSLSITRDGLLLVGNRKVVRHSIPAKDCTSGARFVPGELRPGEGANSPTVPLAWHLVG